MRRGSLLQLVAIGILIGGAVSAVALLIPWLPPSAGKERDRIDFVFWFTTGICIAIFAVVAAVTVYSVLKFRARPDDDSDGPPIHGHTGLEVVWTAVPAVLVTAIAIVSAVVLSRNDSFPKDHLTVDVTAQQFTWSFKYPGQGNVTSTLLRLPLHKSVKLNLHSLDVIHSFYVPEFGQKQDAVPGITTHLKITPTKLGSFPVICTELCGLGHALMRSQAIVMQPAAFEQWAKESKKGISGPGAGKAVFDNNGCGGCHLFTPAGSKGTVGPDLDKLPADAKQAGKPLEAFTRESIVKPEAYIQPGYPPNVMPKTFGTLPKSQLDALVQFLIQSGKKGAK
ncbi:MAG TPA: cytochrome c oxidase subunit II [Gaiellaceae bacterium]